MRNAPLTQQRLMELLHYSPDTGGFVWLERRGGWADVGTPAGRVGGSGRVEISVDGARYYAHRLAWLYVYGAWPNGGIDHINCNPRDNRITNLRLATRSENQCNRGATRGNSSGVKGVSWYALSKKWRARIAKDKKVVLLGLFDTREDAAAAYAEAAKRLHGEFARS